MLITFIGQAMAFSSSASIERTSESHNQNNHQNNLAADIAVNDNDRLANSVSTKKHNDYLTDCSDLDCCELDCCTINVCENDCVCAASGLGPKRKRKLSIRRDTPASPNRTKPNTMMDLMIQRNGSPVADAEASLYSMLYAV